MKDLQNTKKILNVTIVLAVLSFFLYGFLFWTIRAKNQEVSSLLNEADLDLKKDESLRLIKTSLDENEESVALIDSYFVSKDGLVDFIETLEDLGKSAGVNLNIGSVSKEADSGSESNYRETLRVHIETNGSWTKTFFFLSALENLPYQIEVEQVSVSLFSAADKLFFSAGNRVPSAGETWRGAFDIKVIKLK